MPMRYRKKNRRYKVKIKSTKMPWDKKIKIQAVVSALLLVILIGMSFFNSFPRRKIANYLYSTYTLSRWKEVFLPVMESAGKLSKKSVDAYLGLFGEKKMQNPVSDTPAVKADRDRNKKKTPENVTAAAENTPKATADDETEPLPEEEWRMPHSGSITSPYGERIHPVTGKKTVHSGVDIAANTGDPVFAVHSGTVERTGYDESNGNYVVLSHGGGITSVYIHLSSVSVKTGEIIKPNGKIGEAGSTGISTGPHLHFEIKENGVSRDPGKYIKQ